jgi:antitoxin StbD
VQTLKVKKTTSITEFKANPNEQVRKAGHSAFAVLTNNLPSFYVLPPALFEKIADMIEDIELEELLTKRINEPEKFVDVNLDEL